MRASTISLRLAFTLGPYGDDMLAAHQPRKRTKNLVRATAVVRARVLELGMNDDGRGSVDPYMLERWYPWLKEHTAATTFVSLSKAEAEAMRKACEARRKKGTESKEGRALLAVVLKRMEVEMAQPAFVKLSARSCKDSILRSTHFKNVLAKEMAALQQQQSRTPNDLITAYVRAQCFAMRRDTAAEALEDMLESRRIYEDLTLALLEPSFRMEIVFRTWDERLIPEREVRCFVAKGRVAAVSQYYSSVYVPYLAENKAAFETRLLEYCAQLLKVIPLESYTLDVGMRDDGSLCVVELNPPAPRSGPALFVWNYGAASDKADNEILTGDRPFEFRVLTAPLATVEGDRKQTFEHLRQLGYVAEEHNEKCVVS
jgi:hypothetical protein